jgi:hypothetical protein
MFALGGLRNIPFKRDDFRFRHNAELENLAQPAPPRGRHAVSSYAYLRRLGYPLGRKASSAAMVTLMFSRRALRLRANTG